MTIRELFNIRSFGCCQRTVFEGVVRICDYFGKGFLIDTGRIIAKRNLLHKYGEWEICIISPSDFIVDGEKEKLRPSIDLVVANPKNPCETVQEIPTDVNLLGKQEIENYWRNHPFVLMGLCSCEDMEKWLVKEAKHEQV